MKTLRHLTLLLAAALAVNSHAATNAAKTFQYQVKVVDASGQPVSGAIVERYRGPEWSANADPTLRLEEHSTTGADGTVSLLATNQAMFTLLARKPGLSLGWTLCLPGFPGYNLDEGGSLELTLTAPTAVSGIVRDAAGKPIPDATVWVRSAFQAGKSPSWTPLNSRLGRKFLATRTGSDGKFRIDGLPADASLDLAAAKPSLALDQPAPLSFGPSSLKFQAGQADIVLTLNPAGTIQGRVLQEDTATPLVGARVILGEDPWNDNPESSPTGPNGRFLLADLSPGEYKLHATVGTNRFPDWVCDTATVSVLAGATSPDVELTAIRGGVLEVTVRNQAGDQPLKDATITVSRESRGQLATTSDQGIARLRLVPGTYHLFVLSQGFKSHQSQATLEAGQTNQLQLTLEPAARIAGTVVGPDGKPAAKVKVCLLSSQGENQTDAEGRFTLTSDPNQFGGRPNFQPIIIARDPTRNLAATFDLEDESTNLTLRLAPALTVAGRVTDEKGKAITNAQARLMFRTERMSSSLGVPVPVNAEGRFELKALPANRAYTVNVSANGFGQDQRNVEAQEPGTQPVEVEPVQLALADQQIAGVVVDSDDKPVGGAFVNVSGEKQPNLNGRTDAKGRFSFDHVCAGQINLSANNQQGGYGSVTAEAGHTNLTVQLGVSHASPSAGGSAKLAGIITDADGKPAAKVTVMLFPYTGTDKQTDAEGRFKLSFNPNQWSGSQETPRVLIARDPARNLATALEVEPEATNATLKLAPGLTLSGRITDSQGKALTNAEAQVMFRTERFGSMLGAPVRVDSDGRFEIKALPTGRRYSVTASAKGFGRDDHRSIEPAETETRATLEPLQLLVADQRIAGVVLDADDKPVANASLYCFEDKQPANLSGRTDSKGRFAFDKVCAGPIRVSASTSSSGYADVTAQAGDTNITLRIKPPSGRRAEGPRLASLKGKPLPDLAPLGLAPADCPADQPVLALLIDAEQRPSRRALRLLGEQAAALKQKGVAVLVLQAGAMADDAFVAWKQEAAMPFPVGRLKGEPEKARAAWGAGALPWLILTDKAHRVTAEGFAPEDLDAKLQTPGK